ncbi:hypothetical protein [Labilithrix luteola]|nr:hypothetical protein [Labilithrix luteola]
MRLAIWFSVVGIASMSMACAARKPPPPAAPVSNATPELRAAVEKASACNYDAGRFDAECEGYKAWEANSELANAGLLEMMTSEDTKVRALVVRKLSVQFTADNADKDTLAAYLNAAEKEKVEPIAKDFARGIGSMDLGKFGLLDRGIAIAKAHSVADYQETYASALKSESEPDKVLAYAGELAKSEDLALRNAALRMFVNATKSRGEVACAGLDALRTDKDPSLAQHATTHLAHAGACAKQHDALLAAIEEMKLSKNPAAAEPYLGEIVESICQNAEKTPAQRDRSLVLAKQITETTKIQGATRSSTLAAVLACDPKAGPAFVKKFSKDKDAVVAERAKSLLEGTAAKK